jgi:hypothetical protein
MNPCKRVHADHEDQESHPSNLMSLFDPLKKDAADMARNMSKIMKAKSDGEARAARTEAIKANTQQFIVQFDPLQSDIIYAVEQTVSAHKCLKKSGFVILKSPSCPSSSSTMIPPSLLCAMYGKAEEIQEIITARLNALNISYSNRTLFQTYTVKSDKRRMIAEAEASSSFKFREVSSRCFGRLDIRYGMQEPPFTDPVLKENAPWLPIVYSMLGEDAVLKYTGLITSFPGSLDQPWHGDGPHLFESQLQCPPHALNVFIPLHEITEQLGPTEFVPGSHKIANASRDNELLKTNPKGVLSISPLLDAGTILLYDYRVIHRGTQNCSDRSRHMFYLLYTKPWFNENINFGDISIFEEEAVKKQRRSDEDPTCAGFYNII